MTHQEYLSAFHSQLDCLHRVAIVSKFRRDSQVLLSEVLSFAESMMQCLDLKSATERMQRDQGAALSFLEIAGFQEQYKNKIGTSAAPTGASEAMPFFVLGSALQRYLLSLKKRAPDQWK
jgi:hypothetical protein